MRKTINKVLPVWALLLSMLVLCSCNKVDDNLLKEELSTVEFSGALYEYTIPLTSIRSDEAKEAIKIFDLEKDDYVLEYKGEESGNVIVYSSTRGIGYDAEGLLYDSNAKKVGNCPVCDKMRGLQKDMCDGSCTSTYIGLSAGSIYPSEVDTAFSEYK